MNDHPFRSWFPERRRHEHGLPDPPRHPPPAEFEIAALRQFLAARGAADVGVPTLARHAEILEPGGWVAAFLREHCSDLDVELALQLAAVTQTATLHRALSAAIERMRGCDVVALPPLPPSILDRLFDLDSIEILDAEHNHPLNERRAVGIPIADTVAVRERIASADVILFEAAIVAGTPRARQVVAELIDPRLVRMDAQMLVHLRTRHDGDFRLDPEIARRLQRI